MEQRLKIDRSGKFRFRLEEIGDAYPIEAWYPSYDGLVSRRVGLFQISRNRKRENAVRARLPPETPRRAPDDGRRWGTTSTPHDCRHAISAMAPGAAGRSRISSIPLVSGRPRDRLHGEKLHRL
jgi:hypothetical protein